jgi:hypothetical protein
MHPAAGIARTPENVSPRPPRRRVAEVLATPLAQRLPRIWESDSRRLDERLEIIGDAVSALSADRLTNHARADAERAAHMLAGTAGTFGFTRASQNAYVLELEIGHARPADASWLSAVLGELRSALDRA